MNLILQNLLKIMKIPLQERKRNKAYTVMILINVIQIHLLNYNILEVLQTLTPLQERKRIHIQTKK